MPSGHLSSAETSHQAFYAEPRQHTALLPSSQEPRKPLRQPFRVKRKRPEKPLLRAQMPHLPPFRSPLPNSPPHALLEHPPRSMPPARPAPGQVHSLLDMQTLEIYPPRRQSRQCTPTYSLASPRTLDEAPFFLHICTKASHEIMRRYGKKLFHRAYTAKPERDQHGGPGTSPAQRQPLVHRPNQGALGRSPVCGPKP